MTAEELYQKALRLEKNKRDKRDRWAIQMFTQAAEMGHVKAQLHLGHLYWGGYHGDMDKAFHWFSKAMEAGEPEAFYFVAMCYRWPTCPGVSINDRKCFTILRKGAMLGDPICMECVAQCYCFGYGVKQNHEKALAWYKKCAKAENSMFRGSTYIAIGDFYYEGLGVEKDYDEAVRWYQKAADEGWTRSFYKLGVCCLNGTGLPLDPVKAEQYFLKAKSYEPADERLKLMSREHCFTEEF